TARLRPMGRLGDTGVLAEVNSPALGRVDILVARLGRAPPPLSAPGLDRCGRGPFCRHPVPHRLPRCCPAASLDAWMARKCQYSRHFRNIGHLVPARLSLRGRARPRRGLDEGRDPWAGWASERGVPGGWGRKPAADQMPTCPLPTAAAFENLALRFPRSPL